MRQSPDRSAWLFEPRPSLSGLIFAAVARDTRGLSLSARDRFTCLPASPFCALSFVFDGELHLVEEDGGIAEAPMPAFSFSGAIRRPFLSYAPGPVYALTIAFYPDAWREVLGFDVAPYRDKFPPAQDVLDERAGRLFGELRKAPGEPPAMWCAFEETIESLWGPRGATAPIAHVRDWTRTLFARAARSGAGRSARQAQRRLKSWTGLSARELLAHARIETLFERTHGMAAPLDLARLAAEAGYADQSHMGRELKRLTGASPAELISLISSEERYWVYRLLGERF